MNIIPFRKKNSRLSPPTPYVGVFPVGDVPPTQQQFARFIKEHARAIRTVRMNMGPTHTFTMDPEESAYLFVQAVSEVWVQLTVIPTRPHLVYSRSE